MNLQENFEALLLDIQSNDLMQHNVLAGKSLKLCEEIILNCDEFKDVDELIIIESPSLANTDNEILDSISYKISDKSKFLGKAYLYSIGLTPRLYDENNKPFHSIIVRGIFEKVGGVSGYDTRDIGELNLDYENQPFFTVFCISKSNFLLEHKHLPIELKELFIKTFDIENNVIPNLEEVNIFLEKNKINKL